MALRSCIGLMVAASLAGPRAASAARASNEGAVGTTRQAIVGGVDSDASQNAVVLLMHAPPEKNRVAVCSGTLLAPRLVLTARHCVAATDSLVACTGDGIAASGGQVHGAFDATNMFVFSGSELPTAESVLARSVRGETILDDGAPTICNHDLALLVLEQPLADATIAPVRLDERATSGEKVTVVGWGATEAASIPAVRQQRTDPSVLAVGPSERFGMAAAQLAIGEGACGGDSGGPAFAASGAVIGIVSRGGNGSVEPGVKACLGGVNVYTMTGGFRDLVLTGYALAGAEPWLEGHRDPRLPPAPRAAETSAGDGGESGCGCSAPGRDGRVDLLSLVAIVLAAARARRARVREMPSPSGARYGSVEARPVLPVPESTLLDEEAS